MRSSVLVIIATSVLLVGSATHGTSQIRKLQVVTIDGLHPYRLGALTGAEDQAMRALWSNIKKQLTAPNGEEYFRLSLKNADVSRFMGTLISATPSQQPSTLVLGISDASTPEVTLQLKNGNGQDDHFNGPLMIGSQVQFGGIPVAFTQNPFMLTFVAIISSARK